jgi:hypothetical protein
VIGVNRRIKVWRVEKCLGLDAAALQVDFWRIEQELDKKIRGLDRKMISCRDGERMATLLKRSFLYKAALEKIRTLG